MITSGISTRAISNEDDSEYPTDGTPTLFLVSVDLLHVKSSSWKFQNPFRRQQNTCGLQTEDTKRIKKASTQFVAFKVKHRHCNCSCLILSDVGSNETEKPNFGDIDLKLQILWRKESSPCTPMASSK
ncbi:hypothetical protein M758_3G135100 [Ceratodon purpureus]|nr:hypothetical protein M758_3G135100 [Ceratodon purpureus]